MAGMETDMEGPSNSNIMKQLEEGRRLPWRLVTHTTWMKLANKLDLPSPVSNNDWKGLAEHLGFSTEDILVLDYGKERSTIALFTNYLPKKDATVNNVAKALKQMNRDDALQILLDAVPDIEAQYDSESQRSAMEAVEGTETCVTTIGQGACGCLGSPVLSFSSQHGAGGCSPCRSHPRHAPHTHCTLASGACCCHHVGNMHYHNPPVSCMHPHSHANRASPLATQSGCRGVGSVAMSNIPPHSYSIASGTSHQEHSYKSYTSGAKGGDFYSPSSPSHPGVVRSPLSQHPKACSSPLHHQYLELAPTSYSQGKAESMVVHQDLDSTHHGDLRSFLPDNGSMEVDGDTRDPPALLHTAIARGQGMVSMSPMNGRALPLDVVTDMGDDTPSTSLEELSSSDSSSRLSGLPPNVIRQVSEECNANQPFFPVATSPKPRPMYENEGSNSMTSWAAAGDGQRHVSGGNQLGNVSNKEGQSFLKELENLSHMPSRFMPDNRFTKFVAEQQIEDVAPNQRGLRVNIKRERDSSRSCQFSSLSSSRSGCTSNGKPKGADTYPLRIKPQIGGATVDQVRNRQPGVLTKTTSLPIDMKVEEFKKAFRHIKVFVTYANDSKHHCRQVLSLCNCLDRNGFSCCVDVSSRHDTADQAQATQDWCGRKFKEADFVLICLSPQYLHEIKATDSSNPSSSNSSNNNNNNNSKADKNSLHTAYIYQLMQEEFYTSKRCSRFVPLYMEGSTCSSGPPWLTKHLSYHWPRQYKDLLWMLTKPEDRIKQRSRSSPQKGHNVLKDKINGRHDDQLVSSPLN